MGAPADCPALVPTDEDLKLVCSLPGEQFEVGPLALLGESKAGDNELLGRAADLICDVLAVKQALDAGQPLECLRLRSRTDPLSLPAGAASKPRSMALSMLVQQLQSRA
ncbi:hypothetical protein ABPG75_013985 [Micractinium tetrahymenae]